MPEPDLLVTKFTIPPVRSVLLHRSHLLTVLEQSRSVPLTLLSASAGFGKTTLLSAWASQSTSQVAWLTLDAQDNDLILDDYQAISEPAIHTSLQFVLDRLPPRLHLCLSSRVDPQLPLARLRAKGQVVEIREPELRLNGEEAAGFLTQVMGLSLSTEEIGRLEQRTE